MYYISRLVLRSNIWVVDKWWIKVKKPNLQSVYPAVCSTRCLHDKSVNSKKETMLLRNLSVEDRRKLELYKLEYELLLSQSFLNNSSKNVPHIMEDIFWAKLLLEGDSFEARKELFKQFRILEIDKREKEKINNSRIDCVYTINDALMLEEARVAQSMMFGRPLIIDMNMVKDFTIKEYQSAVQQINTILAFNRLRSEPFDISFTNCHIKEHSDFKTGFMAKTTRQSYLDIYPPEKMIYLSPYARDNLLEDNPDSIYIIAGYMDFPTLSRLQPPKRETIKSAKLPLNYFLRFYTAINWLDNRCDRVLSTSCMVKVMCEFMDTNDWNEAFRYVNNARFRNDDFNKGTNNSQKKIYSNHK